MPSRIPDLVLPSGPRARLAVLFFHRVLAQPDPLFPEILCAADFRRLMAACARGFHVLPLPRALELRKAGALPAGALAITFDDGYRDNLDVALPILRELDLHATFFISSDFCDGPPMWNDRVIEALRTTSRPTLLLEQHAPDTFKLDTAATRRRAIDTLLAAIKHLPPDSREAAVTDIERACATPTPPAMMMHRAELIELHRAGMGIGAHTLTHPILASLDDETAAREIAGSRRVLEDWLQTPVDLFAYPNGKPGADFLARDISIAREAGFKAAFTTVARAAASDDDDLQLPRFSPWRKNTLAYALTIARQLRG